MDNTIAAYGRCTHVEQQRLLGMLEKRFADSSIGWSFGEVDIRAVSPMCKHVYSNRLQYARNSIQRCIECNIKLFEPYWTYYKDGTRHLIVPPIVEIRNGMLYLGDGMHRLYAALELGINTMGVLQTSNCALPLAGIPQKWEDVIEAPMQLPVEQNFECYCAAGYTGYSDFCNGELFWGN